MASGGRCWLEPIASPSKAGFIQATRMTGGVRKCGLGLALEFSVQSLWRVPNQSLHEVAACSPGYRRHRASLPFSIGLNIRGPLRLARNHAERTKRDKIVSGVGGLPSLQPYPQQVQEERRVEPRELRHVIILNKEEPDTGPRESCEPALQPLTVELQCRVPILQRRQRRITQEHR